MLKKVLVFFTYFIFFILALIYFIPKASAYYFLESKLKTHSIIVANEEIADQPLCLRVKNTDIYADSIKFANISEVDIHLFVIYNRVVLTDITLSNIAKTLVPLKVNEVEVSYSILNPFNIKAFAVGDFGELDATYSVFDGALHLELTPSKLMLMNYAGTLKQLKKTEQGDYTYDKIF
ncbi:MAG: hypothetical protein ABFQ64_05835 [Campylobacterota bacterium]